MTVYRLIYTFMLWVLCFVSQPEAREGRNLLVASYGIENPHPQIVKNKQNKLIGGILYDITNAIAAELHMGVKFVEVPRKRIEQLLYANRVDINCAANPKWYAGREHRWSRPLYDNPDLLINRLDLLDSHDLDRHLSMLTPSKPAMVGTVLGYRYPVFDDLFKSGRVRRMDSLSPVISYKRFIRGDYDSFIIASLESLSLYFPEPVSRLVLVNNPIHCVYSKKLSPGLIEALDEAIDRLIEAGTIEAILARYQTVY